MIFLLDARWGPKVHSVVFPWPLRVFAFQSNFATNADWVRTVPRRSRLFSLDRRPVELVGKINMLLHGLMPAVLPYYSFVLFTFSDDSFLCSLLTLHFNTQILVDGAKT